MILKDIAKSSLRFHSAFLGSTPFTLSTFRCFSTNGTKTDLVITEKIAGITTIGINQPEKRNCIDIATADALLQAFKDFDADNSSKVAILYGVGGNFSAGLDLKEISTKGMNIVAEAASQRGPMGPTRYETSKPVIGAVEGFAVAGGMELALWCDIRIMDETAVMGIFCRRWGVPLIDGGAVRLPSIVGLGRALDIILTGRPVRAKEALEIGLAHKVVACGTAIGNAMFYAEALETYPQEALKTDRNTARRSAFFSANIQEALDREKTSAAGSIEEASQGATTFAKGKGRHGAFDVNLEAFAKSDEKKP